MKLFYYQDKYGNFGDDLNPWLWDQLLPGAFDNDGSELFVGIGTLINHKLPEGVRKHIFGSGFGYGDPPLVDASYEFHAVRGPKTAEVLGIDRGLAITDSAILVRTVDYPQAGHKEYAFGFMPHCESCRNFEWDVLCEPLGFRFISAQWDVDRVLIEMSKCEVLICEAMHGAIVADALRIPWIPVSCYRYISTFKWQDWLATLNLEYEPFQITSVYNAERNLSPKGKLKNRVKRTLRSVGVWRDRWFPPPQTKSSEATVKCALEDLRQASRLTPIQSDESLCDELTNRYVKLLDAFKTTLIGAARS